ncbi:MAG: DUF1365 domain-containing protein [Ilumatobacteraceae bacterium]
MTLRSGSGSLRRAAIYRCETRHTRTAPIRNSFRYGGYMWLVDIDDLPRLPQGLGALARFEPKDHLGDPERSIRHNVDAFCERHGIDLTGGRVVMLANARVLGYVFNPLSVYWCYDARNELVTVLAEVHNTYGERHVYLLRPDESGRACAGKRLYVSPFFDMEGTYEMRLREPRRAPRRRHLPAAPGERPVRGVAARLAPTGDGRHRAQDVGPSPADAAVGQLPDPVPGREAVGEATARRATSDAPSATRRAEMTKSVLTRHPGPMSNRQGWS